MRKHRQDLGRWGETIAEEFLVKQGYRIVARNARTPYGEIDLVARQGDATVFVEVKTRTSASYGFPEEAITVRKREHLIESSQAYLQEHPELDGDWRIDVIAIQHFDPAKEPLIEHLENAIY